MSWMRLSLSVVLLLGTVSLSAAVAAEKTWDRVAAARYLDERASLWMERSRPRQKLEQACVSCHTGMPYLISRASIDGSLPDPALEFFADVEARVTGWKDARVWYEASRGAEKPDQSRGTESVLNALVLSLRDQRAPGALSGEAKLALAHMWAEQKDDGKWSWLHFGLAPWESDGSEFWGASLAIVAAMAQREEVTPPADGLARLRRYLRGGLSGETNLHNRLSLLWAASVWDGLLSESEVSRLAGEVLEQQRADGGFRLVDLAPWPSKDGSAPHQESDGYATAFSTFVLQQLDEARYATAIARGVSWLQQNQEADGRWETLSPNRDRSKEEAFTRLLASDAATAFAVLVLSAADSALDRATDSNAGGRVQ